MHCWLSRQISIPRAGALPGVPVRRGLPHLPIAHLHLQEALLLQLPEAHPLLPEVLLRRGLLLRHTALLRTITGAALLLQGALQPSPGAALRHRAGVPQPSREALQARVRQARAEAQLARTGAALLLPGALQPRALRPSPGAALPLRGVLQPRAGAQQPRAGVQQPRTGVRQPRAGVLLLSPGLPVRGSQGQSAILPGVPLPAVPTAAASASRTRGLGTPLRTDLPLTIAT